LSNWKRFVQILRVENVVCYAVHVEYRYGL
jgi:hypothetical protein